MSRRKNVPLWDKPWHELSPKEQNDRKICLTILKEMRRYNNTLDRVPLPEGVTMEFVIANIKSALKLSGDKWVPRCRDHISRGMNIIENGCECGIVVNDSREASKVGKYYIAVNGFLDTGDESFLTPFKGATVKDSDGLLHVLETDPAMVREAMERLEGGSYEVYE